MRKLIAFLFIASAAYGQDLALARLKHELVVARAQQERHEEGGAARIAAVHAALSDWLEPQLPKELYSLAGEVSRLEASLPQQLAEAGLSHFRAPGTYPELDEPGFDEVALDFRIMPELPDMLFVTATVQVQCGEDQAVYVYRFDANGRTRVIDDHPKSDWGYAGVQMELSDPDLQGRRLLFIHHMSTQCASTWVGMTYAVYRMIPSKVPESLLSSGHGYWLDSELFVLTPDQLMIELVDTGVDTERRTNILRYRFADRAKRIDPVAFQAQDFAEEWLTRPWSEMQSRSAPELEKWHSELHADFMLGSYSVVLCSAKPDRRSVGFEINHIGEKELKEPMEVHFLVHDLGGYGYSMEAIRNSEFEGCSGEGFLSDKHPWLTVEQLKALP